MWRRKRGIGARKRPQPKRSVMVFMRFTLPQARPNYILVEARRALRPGAEVIRQRVRLPWP